MAAGEVWILTLSHNLVDLSILLSANKLLVLVRKFNLDLDLVR